MALFLDGPPSAIADLVLQDTYLLAVVGNEGINVTNKLALAYNELQIELTSIFGREASIYAPVLGEASLDTGHIAVTPALKLWHTYRSLELVYRDAYFNQLNDRYQGKWAEFQRLSLGARSLFIDTGAGLVIDPIAQPAAPVITFDTAAGPGGTVYFAVTFVNAESQESSPSVIVESAVPEGNLAMVGAAVPPSNAVGWNLYGGISPNALTLQNASPVAIGSILPFTPPGATDGVAPGTGQAPDVTRDLPRRIMRG
jgi:hypothetical protein